uniref:Uncharacterized protein LOC108049523 isoform X3 n=1 Tax=Drosophila rhopaloa TaxID=1041015 RepID=A0A6P4F6Z6_DRORH
MQDLLIPSPRLRTVRTESKRSRWRPELRRSSRVPRTWPLCGKSLTMWSCGLRRRPTGEQSTARNRNRARKSDRVNFKNGKVVNRARGFVVRIFDAICNCANNNAAAATTRFKLRSNSGGGGGSGDGGGASGNGKRQQSQDEPETLVLTKKKPASEGKKRKASPWPMTFKPAFD